MPDDYVYNVFSYETINCTANINPNTTVLSLVGKALIFSSNYVFAEGVDFKIFVNSENESGCNPIVRFVYFNVKTFLSSYNIVGCLANDTLTGESIITEFKKIEVSGTT